VDVNLSRLERARAAAAELTPSKPHIHPCEVARFVRELKWGGISVGSNAPPRKPGHKKLSERPKVEIIDGVTFQTAETVFSQYVRHPEYKSVAPDGTPCKADTHGLLRRYPVTAAPEFHLIGKETERGWEQADDISTLLPSLKRYERNMGTAAESLRQVLHKMSLSALQRETGLSRHTILRAGQGERVYPRSLQLLKAVVSAVPIRKR